MSSLMWFCVILLVICEKSSGVPLMCNYIEVNDNSSIYTCELFPKLSENDKESHVAGKNRSNVKSIKYDGYNNEAITHFGLKFCHKFPNLEILRIFSAKIETIDANVLKNCKNLKILSLSLNEIVEIPKNLFTKNPKLTSLNLEQNNLITLPENVMSNLKILEELNLNRNQINTLPAGIFDSLVNLQKLGMEGNKIETVNKAWFKNLKKLKILKLSNNKIFDLVENNFESLKNLFILDLSQNNITKLDQNVFKNLQNLQELYLDSNSILNLTTNAFTPLVNLRILSMGDNNIEDLPKIAFQSLTKLEELRLFQNNLRYLNYESFEGLDNLRTVDLEGNKIYSIHVDFVNKTKITTLFMEGNECYNGDIETKAEMMEKLKNCFSFLGLTANHLPSTKTIELVNFDVIPVMYNFTIINLPDPVRNEYSGEQGLSVYTTSKPIINPITKPTITSKATTRRVTTTRRRATTTIPYTTTTEATTLKATTTPAPLTATTSSWNFIVQNAKDACGKRKMKFGATLSGNKVKHGAYPWTAALIRDDGHFFCGGTLVSKKSVITAAHCLEGKAKEYSFKPQDFFVILGANNIKKFYDNGKVTIGVAAVHIHHDWNTIIDSYDADIAILELEEEVNFSRFIQPICIPEAGSIPAKKGHGFVVGYGKTEFAEVQEVARLVETPIHGKNDCYSSNSAYNGLLSHRGFCGGYGNGTGVCTGDSGSGLIVVHNGIHYLRGIVSASITGPLNGCNLKTYSMFTDVLEFAGWIRIGKDDKTLIQYLLEKIRTCELENEELKKAKTVEFVGSVEPEVTIKDEETPVKAMPIKSTRVFEYNPDNDRIVFPDD